MFYKLFELVDEKYGYRGMMIAYIVCVVLIITFSIVGYIVTSRKK